MGVPVLPDSAAAGMILNFHDHTRSLMLLVGSLTTQFLAKIRRFLWVGDDWLRQTRSSLETARAAPQPLNRVAPYPLAPHSEIHSFGAVAKVAEPCSSTANNLSAHGLSGRNVRNPPVLPGTNWLPIDKPD